jgi:hypothetical protein
MQSPQSVNTFLHVLLLSLLKEDPDKTAIDSQTIGRQPEIYRQLLND